MAGEKARGDEEVAGAFGGGFGEEWGFDFPESEVAQVIAHHLGDACAGAECFLHLISPQIEIAIGQPLFLTDRLMLIGRERRRRRLAEDLHRAHAHFISPVPSLGLFIPWPRISTSPPTLMTHSLRSFRASSCAA